MSYDDDQKEYLPGDGKRRSSQHLPRYFRTRANEKFLSSTLDQLIQPGVAEKLNGYFGRTTSKSFTIDDTYIGDVSDQRKNYQLEPATVIKDELDNVLFYKDYNDYINQINSFGGNTDNHSRLNKQEYYAWNPHIDWDKFTNFREYYWLPNGPQTIEVRGESLEIDSTYTVSLSDNGDNNAYLFSPDGKTVNPSLKLYRGVKYRFDISTPGLPFTIRTKRTLDDEFLFDGIVQNIEDGTIEFTLDTDAPDILYYVADNDINVAGLIKVANIDEASFVDVETEIIGKKDYTTGAGFALSNGMKIRFVGDVTPATYSDKIYYVEGVGDKITLIPETALTVSSAFAGDVEVEFDSEGFDRLPFDEASGYPIDKDYIVINRASQDGNLWSRYNRWFHKSVIEQSAKLNDQPVDVDQNQRAKRPIIEFEKGIKLNKFGTYGKGDVDLIDTFTSDVFSNIEGSQGYNIDGVDITDGMRILFTGDQDKLVNGKIYQVKFINFSDGTGRSSNRQISLIETTDSNPVLNETILVKDGNQNKGFTYYYNGSQWVIGQRKTQVNQPPLFEIFDEEGISYADSTNYESTNFLGNKIFSYVEGEGTVDTELGFALKYKNIENVGDITFNFDLTTEYFEYQLENQNYRKYTDIGFLRKYSDIDTFDYINGWTTGKTLSDQVVIRQYVYDNTNPNIDIDVYDESNTVTDLWLRVIKNNKLLFENIDYTVENGSNGNKRINFVTDLVYGDNILLKTKSKKSKNDNGFYELSYNLERNPSNENLTEFTLGQVNDHVSSIVEQMDNFEGIFPGVNNLRDQFDLSSYGRRFIKHSVPMNLGIFSLTDKESNLLFAIRNARKEYGKFKRKFLQVAEELGYEGPVKEHVDKILSTINKDKVSSMPYYFSDMIPTGATRINTFEIADEQQQFFATTEKFDLKTLSRKAVQVYLNGNQLIHGLDYTFNDDGFIVVTAEKQIDDVITVYEYESTNGSYVPPTPTKLGLYPKYQPKIYFDDTIKIPGNVVQGHDGSIIVAYNDYRDNLLLELEKRIFNNIKIEYDPNLIDMHSFKGGEFRKTDYSKYEIDISTLPDFVEWLRNVRRDYTTNNFERTNSFTFNYSEMTNAAGEKLPGFWRQVYKEAFDTDRPHTHPWEMLGFTIEPKWWRDVYGPAPYTKDNLPLWEDLENGVIRDPSTRYKINKKYIRPGLTSHIPVDENGVLLSPNESGYALNFNSSTIKDDFVFGDGAPVESAWRRSAEYPFSFIASWLLNEPNKLLSVGFDRSRQAKSLANQIIYKDTNNQLRLSDVIFPNTIEDKKQIFTSGLVNYVAGYMSASVTTPFNNYKKNIKSITNQIGFKIGGFTDKTKFKLVLDSRTPLNQGNVFVPEENYKIILNTSSAVETVSYSGVIIERLTSGYKISGYDNLNPYFLYNKAIPQQNDPTINVGGISEPYVTWDAGKTYAAGINVENAGIYYRVTKNFVSGQTFDDDSLSKLPALPLIGGREGTLRRTFYRNLPTKLPYGTVLKTVQEVVDFLLGYQDYQIKQGFVFDYYNKAEETVSDWRTSVKEFLFWTTQNWGAGSAITLSPGAEQIKFNSQYSIVDNIFDSFYGYTLLKADGKKLVQEFSTLGRQEANQFVLTTKNTEDGIFAVKLPLIQKEHVVLLDNTTEFGDTIYDPRPGYRQERIKVLGYRTDGWDGSINIPGFMYDDAKVTTWEAWQDYSIGSIVKYKEYYYTANQKVPGAETFDSKQWNILSSKPEASLIPNFEYKTNQFADFYDLDSDNFDVEQQKLAQHLIGYQKRTYLENIINDDVSQYKFYQGFIQDKGTKNALTKLFDALASNDKDSLEFYEEWAIKQGQYGAADGFEEVEYLLDESKFRLTPQPILLTNTVTGKETDLIYRIQEHEVYGKPKDYTHAPFPGTSVSKEYTRSAGYVNSENIDFIVNNYNDILNLDFTTVNNFDYIWVGNEKLTWNVYQHLKTDYVIDSVEKGTNEFSVVFSENIKDIQPGEILGVYDIIETELSPDDSAYETVTQTTANIGSFYKVKSVLLNRITFEDPNKNVTEDYANVIGHMTKLESVRASDLDNLNNLSEKLAKAQSLFWLDNDGTDSWKVVKTNDGYVNQNIIGNTDTGDYSRFGTDIAVSEANNTIAIGIPGNTGPGRVLIYKRSSSNINWSLNQIIEENPDIATDQNFGESVALSPDGNYLIVGSPNASNVKTFYKDEYAPETTYNPGDIVNYQESLWQTNTDILGSESSIIFSSFASQEQIKQATDSVDEDLDIIIIGNAPLEGVPTDHFLVKAPADMYEGTKVGDEVFFKYNDKSIAHNEQSDIYNRVSILGDDYPTLSIYDSGFLLNGPLTIQKKVDVSMYLFAFTTKPEIGDRVETTSAFGIVNYVYENDGRLVIYCNQVNGTFDPADSLFLENGEFVGEYERIAPSTSQQADTDDELGGYWYFDLGTTDLTTTKLYDEAPGLTIYDVLTEGEADTDRYYYNCLDYYDATALKSEDTFNSYLRILSFQGFPGATETNDPILSPKFVIRAPSDLTDDLIPGDSFELYFPITQRVREITDQGDVIPVGDDNDPTPINLDYSQLNKIQAVDDIWDGYINFEFTKFERSGGRPNAPRVGDICRDVTTGASAEIVYYQRNGIQVTIFVKNIQDGVYDEDEGFTGGSWSLGDDYGDNAEIRIDAVADDPDVFYRSNRVMGQIQFRGFPNPSQGIGKLIVIDTGTDIDVPINPENGEPALTFIKDLEYWFYDENTINGIPRQANIPSEDNNDWQKVFSIPANELGTESGLTSEGMYSVYFGRGGSSYSSIASYIVPSRTDNNRLGNKLELTKFNDLYRLFVHAGSDDDSLTNPGRIYFVKQGTDTDGSSWNWEYAKDKTFKGNFDALQRYYTDDKVYLDGFVYQAKTNLDPGAFDNNDWTRVTTPVDYIGYVPNNTEITPIFDSATEGVDLSTILDQGALLNFGNTFDTSKNGEVLAVNATYGNDKPNAVVIYRALNGNYQRHQTIFAPNDTEAFGKSIALSDDGDFLAIGAPFNDDVQLDQGIVYIYKLQNGNFVKTQELFSRNNEKSEQFGYALSFTGTDLAVGSRTGDALKETSFDTGATVFDNGFTTYAKSYTDSGVVYMYSLLNDYFIYGQTVDFERDNLINFGKKIKLVKDHLYVSLPRFALENNKIGTIVDFRKTNDTVEIVSSQKDTVNVDKIKKVFLYDTKKKELITYLDYIDPIQGKIAGIAEQELRYKTYYDPASYNVGTDSVVVDENNNWQSDQVGQLWWDLTTAKFLNPYQADVTYSTNNWNTLFVGNSIDIYEWVETQYLPSEWIDLVDTEQGIAKGVSGMPRYGNDVYSTKRVYDQIAGTFSTKYYYWVKNKKTVPDVEGRLLSADNVARVIADPAGYGYRFAALISPDSFVLYNCKNLIKDTDVALSVQYWTLENQDINIHNQYQILTEGLESSKPNKDIERKWFDSLIGRDDNGRPVPSFNLNEKQKYGILNTPRQSWFKNNIEAFNQLITRVNRVLENNLIIDDKNLTNLFQQDPAPGAETKLYDTKVDVLSDLEFVGVAKAERAVVTPIIQEGKIVRLLISNPGRGYLVEPTYTINGSGSGAEFRFTLNNVGAITEAEVVNPGQNYTSSTNIEIRRFTVLVESDNTIQGKWALYERISETRKWSRTVSQSFNVRLYWDYIDWYATGYNETTEIDYLIDSPYELQSLPDSTGDIVKISNVGTGGWLLLEKTTSEDTIDYTLNYKTIGRQDGTIAFKETLYNPDANLSGFDNVSFDTQFFDPIPTVEARVILETIRDHIFVNDLSLEYNALFFASLRYVFSEQNFVDWAFKTSFVKAKHNTGELEQKVTFQNDSLPSYEEYLKEVKPFKTKLREYLSDYEKLDNSRSVVTDFDLQPAYSNKYNKILPQNLKVMNGQLVGESDDLAVYPFKNWADNNSLSVVSIDVADGGIGYTNPPTLIISGGGGTGATAKANLGPDGAISNVVITNSGSGYLSTPTLEINGSLSENGRHAKLGLKLGNSVVRNIHSRVKFDRIAGKFEIIKLTETETFVGNNNRYVFDLTFPMDLRTNLVEVIVDNRISLSSEYTFENVLDKTKGYDRYKGRIIFTTPPENLKSIVINYRKPVEYLDAQDRINLFYDPQTGQLANDLGQLMDGIDYGGVEVKSFDFGGLTGWDAQPWYTDNFDSYDSSFEDEIITLDGSTTTVQLSKPLENGIVYNIYKNGVRIDDQNYGTENPITNKNALMPSITGDGETSVVNFGDVDVTVGDGDTIIVRKSTSDGSFIPDLNEFDVQYSGGNLSYSTATGLNAEDIIIDGDGFVTPTTSKGPEELVPGQIVDTVDIKVFEGPIEGSSQIHNRNYIGDGSTTVFDLNFDLLDDNQIFVKIDNTFVDKDSYEVDFINKQIEFTTAPANNARINLTMMGVSGADILEIDSFISDGSTANFVSSIRYNQNINGIVSANGKLVEFDLQEARPEDGDPGNLKIALAEPITENVKVSYALFQGNTPTSVDYSVVTVDTFQGDGSTTAFELEQTPFNTGPAEYKVVVRVNDKILNAGYSQIFDVTTTREYTLDLDQVEIGTLNNQNVLVYLNDEPLRFIRDWSFSGGGAFDETQDAENQIGNTVILGQGIGSEGDELRVYILSDGEYRFGYYETDDDSSNAFVSTPGTLHLDTVYTEDDTITVYQFSNHDKQDIVRTQKEVVSRTVLTVGSDLWYKNRQLRNGFIGLDKPAYSTAYVWVSINNKLLDPNKGYYLLSNKRTIKIIQELQNDDIIQIIHFANNPVVTQYGWRQFKDMLNKTHYKVMPKDNIELVTPLNYYDRVIEVSDASILPEPSGDGRYPGIIEINKERIEYLRKDGNVLKQLRRGTLGTGVPLVHPQGTTITNQNRETTVPYTDELVTTIFTGDETSTSFTLDFTPTSVNEFEVFVGGKRLRKNAISSYRFEYTDDDGNVISPLDQDSPDGDITLPAEFSIDGDTLTLLDPPGVSVKVIVIRKIGKLWSEVGESVATTENEIMKFIRSTSVELPR